jgi:hydrogenase nickel incorporation protein HypB
MNTEPRLVEVRKNVLKQNDIIARALRDQFRDAGVFVASLVSSPGSGKTALLERTLTLLRPHYRVAALVGDLATENDAARLSRSLAPVKQITTGTLCHLEAAIVQSALGEWDVNHLTSFSWKTSEILFARRHTTSARISGLCSCR